MASTRFRFVAEVTVRTDSVGTEATYLFATSGFTTTPGDTPANTHAAPRLADPGTMQRDLFTGARVSGGVRPSFGQVVLLNGDGELDEWLDWGTGGARVVMRYGAEGAAYPGSYTTVYIARIASVHADIQHLRLVLRDRSYLLDRPVVTQTFAGTGNAEGEGIAGRRKQLVIGNPGFVPLIETDAERAIHFVQANAAPASWCNGVGAAGIRLYDAGVVVPFDIRRMSHRSLRINPPSNAHFDLYADDGSGRETGTPRDDAVGPIYLRYTADAGVQRGELRMRCDGRLKNSATDTLRTWRFTDMLQRAGFDDATPSTLAAGSIDFEIGNRLIEHDQTFAGVLNDCARAELLAWGIDRLDTAFAFRLKDPADTSDAADTVQYRFTKHNAGQFRRLPVPGMENPVYQVLVNAGRTWPCTVADTASAETRRELQRQWPYTAFSATASSVLDAHPHAEVVTVDVQGRYFTTPAEQQQFGQSFLALYGGRRDCIRLTVEESADRGDFATLLALELHDKVELELDRFGCSPARTFRIVTVQINLQAPTRSITFTLWGGDAGPAADEVQIADAGDPPDSAGGGSVPGGTPTVPTETTQRDRLILIPDFRLLGRALIELTGAYMRKIFGEFSLQAADTVVADPLYADVVLLVQGGGASSTIVDQSPHAHTITPAGNAQISTTISTFPNGRSLKLDGTGDYAVVPDHAGFTITGEFCVEVRFYLTSFKGGTPETVLAKMANVALAAHEMAVSITQTYIHFYYGTRTSNQFQLRLFWPASASLNTLHEGVIQRNASGDWECWLDGDKGTDYQVSPLAASESFGAVTTGTYNDTVSLGDTSQDVWIGAHFAGGELEGYVHVRMTNATRYSGDYTATPTSRWPTS